MKGRGGIYGGGQSPQGLFLSMIVFFSLVFSIPCFSDIGPEHVLLLVNSESNTSRYIAKMYRWYYPSIQEWQVLELSGLPDSSGPSATAADEIITRDQYDTLIAEPLRSYLLANGIENTIKVLITTAGMPYRIGDTKPAFANVIYPGGSDWTIVKDFEEQVDAASVESELTCLWYAGYGDNPVDLQNRVVNPYQGYRSSFDLFERLIPDASGFNWTFAWSVLPGVGDPWMEGDFFDHGTRNRLFGPGHIYLVSRLDGPKNQGKSAIFSVREMLERAKRASSPASGVNPNQAVIVLDDAPMAPAGDIDENRVFNLNASVDFWEFEDGVPQPPDATARRMGDDYVRAFLNLVDTYTNHSSLYTGSHIDTHYIPAILDYRFYQSTQVSDLDVLLADFPDRIEPQEVIAFSCYGTNGDDGKNKDYLLTGGSDGGPLFPLLNGAVFTSLESFNAVTFFSDRVTSQNKIINFITLGGTAAIGHAFEPQADAAIDNEFLYYNFFADRNEDNRADLTFIEAAYTGIPYLSWSEVVIGDPLMRIAYGPGEDSYWKADIGDIDLNGIVNGMDVLTVQWCYGGRLDTTDESKYQKYYDLCDLDKNGLINGLDVYVVRYLFGTNYN